MAEAFNNDDSKDLYNERRQNCKIVYDDYMNCVAVNKSKTSTKKKRKKKRTRKNPLSVENVVTAGSGTLGSYGAFGGAIGVGVVDIANSGNSGDSLTVGKVSIDVDVKSLKDEVTVGTNDANAYANADADLHDGPFNGDVASCQVRSASGPETRPA